MSEVATEPTAVDTPTEKTSDDWYRENTAKVLSAIVSKLPHRSETESWTLNEAIQNLDKDPATILPTVEPLPLGVNAVDPVLAAVLQQNATMTSQVERLLSVLEGEAPKPTADPADVPAEDPSSVSDVAPVPPSVTQ